MAINSYLENGEQLWSVYVNVRHASQQSIRKQKTVKGIKTEQAALQEEKKLIRTLTAEVSDLVERGVEWGELVDLWEVENRRNKDRGITQTTFIDNRSLLHRWTKSLWGMHAKEIGVGDWRQVFKRAEDEGKSRSFCVSLKAAINGVYRFGIEENHLRGLTALPTESLKVKKRKDEKPPQILTLDEIKKLLREGMSHSHPWHPVWAVALLTGMRAGELHALQWSDIDFDRGIIVCSKSYNPRFKIVKSTKAGYWRNIPLSPELKAFLLDLRARNPERSHVLPRFRDWDKGQQAKPLRMFCNGIGITEIKFHTLRACFATQLLANGVQPARVMKVCGWRDLATMERYIRLAGIDEMGATDSLKIIETDGQLMGSVVSLLDFKANRT